MKYKLGDIVEYIGNDLALLGLIGCVTSVDHYKNTFNVNFYYLNNIYVVKEDEIKLYSMTTKNGTINSMTINAGNTTISSTPTQTIWGGYEDVAVPFEDNSPSFAKMHRCHWKFYFGLNEKFEYCTECDAKREVRE